MKAKLVTVLVAIAVVFTGIVLWRTDRLVFGDRMNWVEAQTRTQINSVNKSVLSELQSQQKILNSLSNDNIEKGRLPWEALSPYYAMATFTISGQQLKPQIFLAKENSKSSQWTLDFVQKAVGPLTGRTTDMRYFIKSFQDAQKGRYVAVLFLEGNRAFGLFGSGENFQAVIDGQKGGSTEFSIINLNGLTVGHSVPEYVGTVLADNPLLKEARSSGASYGAQQYKLKSGDVYGMYEVIPQTNLAVLSTAAVSDLLQGRSSLWTQILLLGLGLILVGSAALLVIVNPTEKQLLEMKEQVDLMRTKSLQATAPQQSEKATAQDPEKTQKEKLEASIKVASALAHEMSGPLTSIMGHSQMILATDPEPNVSEPVQSILRETRGAKSVLNKLLGFAGESAQEKNSLKLDAPLLKVLRELDPLLSQKGVHLQKDLQTTSALKLNSEAISMALIHILQNAVEAMERMPKKSLSIKVFESDEGVHLEIKDTGEGIEPGHIEKIFDPFFTTRSFQNHMGLGLSLAFGILKEHHAEINVESQRGQGTQFSILFKKEINAPAFPAIIRKQKEELVVSPVLPQLKEDSPDRLEAEAVFEEVKASSVDQPASPLDINIDSLLDLPEASELSDDVTVVIQSASPTAEELEQISERALDEVPPAAPSAEPGQTRVEFVNPPEFIEPIKKVSKLDGYHVEIRRPGKRP